MVQGQPPPGRQNLHPVVYDGKQHPLGFLNLPTCYQYQRNMQCNAYIKWAYVKMHNMFCICIFEILLQQH